MSANAAEIILEVLKEEPSVSSAVRNAVISKEMNDSELRMIAERYPSLVKICRILAERPHYTRELLGRLNTWGYGLDEIRRAEYYGLIRREWGDCPGSRKFKRRCLWNYITPRGLRLLEIIEGDEE